MGYESADDAGVFRLNDETALIQTLDFLTPITDSPYEFGQIAAANSLSDVYSMGGKPVTAMNIVCFPTENMHEDVLKETLAGGLQKIEEAGAVLAGGHSVDDLEFKYGLSVTGLVHPKKVVKNCSANTGDHLILTKALGTGIIATAIKGKIASQNDVKNLVKVSSTLNKRASEIMLQFNPSACTDVTGFGLAGHLLEMAMGAGKKIKLHLNDLKIIDGALGYADMGLIPAGSYKTRDFCKDGINIETSVPRGYTDIIFDPQTSGGLLFSVPSKNSTNCLQMLLNEGIEASMVGEVAGSDPNGEISVSM